MVLSRRYTLLQMMTIVVTMMGAVVCAGATTSYLSQLAPTSINCNPNLQNDTFTLTEVPESMRYLYMRDGGFLQPTTQLLGAANTSWPVGGGVRMVLRTAAVDIVGSPLFVHPDVILTNVSYARFVFAPVGTTGSSEIVTAYFDENAVVTVWGNRTVIGQWTITSASIVFKNSTNTSLTFSRSIAISNLPLRLKTSLVVDTNKQIPMYFKPDAATTFCYPFHPSSTFRVSAGDYLPDIKLWLMTATHTTYTVPDLAEPPVITVQLNSSQGITTLTTVNATEAIVSKTGWVTLRNLYFNQPLGAVQLLFTLESTSATKVNTITFFIPFTINVVVSSFTPTNPIVAVDGPMQRFFQCVSGIVGINTMEVPVGSQLGGLVVDASKNGMFESFQNVIAVMQPIYVSTGIPLQYVEPEYTTVVDGLARFTTAYIPEEYEGDVIAFQIYFDNNPDILLRSNPLKAVLPTTITPYNYLSLWTLNEMLMGPSSTFVATSGITLPRTAILVKSSSGDVSIDITAAQVSARCYASSTNTYTSPSSGGVVPIVDGVATFSALQFLVSKTTKCRLVFSTVGFLVADPLITAEGYLYSTFTKAVTISFARHYLLSPYHRQFERSTILSYVPMSDVVIYVRNSDWSVDRTNAGQKIQVASSSAALGSFAYAVGGEVHFHSLYVPACTISCRVSFVAVKGLGTSTLQDNTLLVTGELLSQVDSSSIAMPRLSVNGTGLSVDSTDILTVKASGAPTMFLVEYLDPDLSVHPSTITSTMRLDPKSSGAVLGVPQGNATLLTPTSHQLVTSSGSVLFGAIFTAGRGTAELSFCLDHNVALISSCISVTILVGTTVSLIPKYVVLSSLDGAVVNPVVTNALVVSVQDPSDAAIPPVVATTATTTTPTTTTTTTTPTTTTTTPTTTTTATTTTTTPTTATTATTTTTTAATTTTDTTTTDTTTTDTTTTTTTTTDTTTTVARLFLVEDTLVGSNATGVYTRPVDSLSFSLLYPHQGAAGVTTMYTSMTSGLSSFEQVSIVNPLQVVQNIRISPLATDGDGSSWNAAGFRQDDVDPTPATTIIAYVNENVASFKTGTWLRKLADAVNVIVDRFEVVRTTTAVVPSLRFVGTRIEINIRPPSVFSDGKKLVTNLINEVKQQPTSGCLSTPSTHTISMQDIGSPTFCDVNELQERVESARHCENSLGREKRCDCFRMVMVQYGPMCADAPVMGPTCEHLSRCTDSDISSACAGAQQNIAVQVVIVVFSTAGCLLLLVLVLRFNTLRREIGQRRARLKKGRSKIVGKTQHHDDVFVG